MSFTTQSIRSTDGGSAISNTLFAFDDFVIDSQAYRRVFAKLYSKIGEDDPSSPDDRSTTTGKMSGLEKQPTAAFKKPLVVDAEDLQVTTTAESNDSEQEARIRQIEKHLHAERQLTATLEEALVDLDLQWSRARTEANTWKQAADAHETELHELRQGQNESLRFEERRRQAREARAKELQVEIERAAERKRRSRRLPRFEAPWTNRN